MFYTLLLLVMLHAPVTTVEPVVWSPPCDSDFAVACLECAADPLCHPGSWCDSVLAHCPPLQ